MQRTKGCRQTIRTIRSAIVALSASALLLGRTVPAQACMSYELNSIHFHSTHVDFGVTPRRAAIASRGEYDNRPSTEDASDDRHFLELEPEAEQARSDRRHARLVHGLAEAQARAQAGRFAEAQALYTRLGQALGWNGNLRDRAEVMQQAALQAKQSQTLSAGLAHSLQTYLAAMAAYDGARRAESLTLFRSLNADPQAGFLREHALYQQASLAYEWLDFPRAVDLYEQLLREYPRTIKREAALVMIARCAILPATEEGRRIREGKDALAQLRRQFPHSRFAHAAQGLQARLDLLEKRYPAALHFYRANGDLASVEIVCLHLSGAMLRQARADLLAGYLRRLAAARTYTRYEQAVVAIDRTRRKMSAADAAFFTGRLLNDPQTAAAYLYFRLNHTEIHPADLKRLAKLADNLVARHPAAQLSPLVRAQLAELDYQDRRYDRALRWAERALAAQPHFDRALYVHGAACHKLQRIQEAIADFRTLLDQCPSSGLRAGAREELALLAETQGDWSTALEQYFDLGYQHDIAFLLDARMAPRDMEAYLHRPDSRQAYTLASSWRDDENSRQPACTRRDLVRYSLGIRCLREEQWDQAERWLREVPPRLYRQFSKGRDDWASRPSPDPLSAVRAMRRLHRAIGVARTTNAKAAALFRYASYYHSHGTLLLYNPALWRGMREYGFDFWWNTGHATRQDTAAVRAHMYRHEVYARSRELCLEVARRYPHTSVAPQALYRAACACRALANFNQWWRDENKHANHWTEAIRLMKRLARRYPHHPLAKDARKYASVFTQERQSSW